jgi:hypothetical protein
MIKPPAECHVKYDLKVDEPKELSVVESQFQELEGAYKRLADMVERLENKLESVLTVDIPVCPSEVKSDCPESDRCRVAELLRSYQLSIHGITNRLRSIIDRCQL